MNLYMRYVSFLFSLSPFSKMQNTAYRIRYAVFCIFENGEREKRKETYLMYKFIVAGFSIMSTSYKEHSQNVHRLFKNPY